ncbi:AIM24 family protein [Clostridium disporicum]|uniref:AIM24 family protein n=1 Tax=Clostridium disporicum TaxID=84024 RepID=UPI0034A3CF2B
MSQKKYKIIDEVAFKGATFQILEFEELNGATDIETAVNLFYAREVGMKLRQVRINLENAKIKTEAGALYFYKGHIETETKMGGVTGVFKKAISGGLTNESAMKPLYKGTGEVWLEPSFSHYIVIELTGNSIIVDKGMFYCCSDEIEVSAQMQKNISSTVLGGEGMFQIKLSGHGIVVLESSIPSSEIITYTLEKGEVLKVDGNIAIARSETVDFSVTKSDKSLIGSALNGEGLLNTFKGEGTIWLAPTAPIYNKMKLRLPITNKNSSNLS